MDTCSTHQPHTDNQANRNKQLMDRKTGDKSGLVQLPLTDLFYLALLNPEHFEEMELPSWCLVQPVKSSL